MLAERLDDGRIRIPVAVKTEDGDLIHTIEVIGPGDPRYPDYDRWLTQQEQDGADHHGG